MNLTNASALPESPTAQPKQLKDARVNNHTQTVIACSDCGAKTHVKAGIDTKTAKDAIQRPCGACNTIHNHHCGQGWWIQFGLKRNPCVYGPLQRLRISRDYRMQEARRMGWVSRTWGDEYKLERIETSIMHLR